MFKILIVEDDAHINNMIRELLLNHNYECDSAYSGTEAILRLNNEDFNLIILDLMLPGKSGEEVLKIIREKSFVPVIGLSAKNDMRSKVELLKNGADDYITKPFDNEELLVRIEALLRRINFDRKTEVDKNTYIFKDLTLDRNTMEVKIGDVSILLTKYEYEILKLLMSYPNKIFTKNNIFESVWHQDYIGEENAINTHISNLRKKFIKVNNNEQYIQTVWGLGFKMHG